MNGGTETQSLLMTRIPGRHKLIRMLSFAQQQQYTGDYTVIYKDQVTIRRVIHGRIYGDTHLFWLLT